MNWPFADPENVAVFTNSFIVEKGYDITYVSHDEEDGAWQFHCNHQDTNNTDYTMILALKEIVDIDPSIIELADLPYGHIAERKDKTSKWIIKKSEN
jgi:hypothetical protein